MQNKTSLIGNPPNRAVRRFIGRTLPDLTGFPRDRTDSTITVVGNQLTIAPVGASFAYWYQGRQVTKTAAETVTITDVEGLHYIYYDENDVLQISTTFDIDYIYIQALVAIVYWDAANNIAIYVGDERHGRIMSAETHAHFHLVLGTQWINGLALDGFTIGDGSLDAHAQLGYTAGQIRDEDLEHDNVADTAPATISVLYKSGATGVWRRRTANNFPFIYSGDGSGYVGANGRMPFNEFSGGNWVLTEVSTNNNFVNAHLFAFNDPNQPVIVIQGEVEYTNITDAREGATTEINSIVTAGLPSAEFTPIGTIILQTNGGYANAPNARIRTTDLGANYVDFRGFKFSSTGNPGSHAVLGDLYFGSSGHIGFQPVIFEDAGDPDANDDIAGTGGNGVFLNGYFWRNTTSGKIFICADDTATSAVWREVAIQLSSPTLSDLYVTDGGEIGISSDLRIVFDGAADDLRAILSDSAGVSKFVIEDSSNAPVFIVNSDGVTSLFAEDTEELNIWRNQEAPTYIKVRNDTNSGASTLSGIQVIADSAQAYIIAHGSSRAVTRYGVAVAGYVDIYSGAGNGLMLGTASNATPIIFGTNNLERMRVFSSGDISIGTTASGAQLHIRQNSTTGAQPVIFIEQEDISEEMIGFDGESSASTADQSLVDASDFTTPGSIIAWIKMRVIDNRVGGIGAVDIWVPGYTIPTA